MLVRPQDRHMCVKPMAGKAERDGKHLRYDMCIEAYVKRVCKSMRDVWKVYARRMSSVCKQYAKAMQTVCQVLAKHQKVKNKFFNCFD